MENSTEKYMVKVTLILITRPFEAPVDGGDHKWDEAATSAQFVERSVGEKVVTEDMIKRFLMANAYKIDDKTDYKVLQLFAVESI